MKVTDCEPLQQDRCTGKLQCHAAVYELPISHTISATEGVCYLASKTTLLQWLSDCDSPRERQSSALLQATSEVRTSEVRTGRVTGSACYRARLDACGR